MEHKISYLKRIDELFSVYWQFEIQVTGYKPSQADEIFEKYEALNFVFHEFDNHSMTATFSNNSYYDLMEVLKELINDGFTFNAPATIPAENLTISAK
jgi:hypothetical protein